MCCPTQPVLALSGSEPLTPIGPDSATSWGALACLTGDGPRGSENFAPPPPHHCPSSDAWGLFSGLVDGERGHRSGEARPPRRGNFLEVVCSPPPPRVRSGWLKLVTYSYSSASDNHLQRAGWGLLGGGGWGGSQRKGLRLRRQSLCLQFPGAHVLRRLEAAGGRVWDR